MSLAAVARYAERPSRGALFAASLACAAAGLVIGGITMTGLAAKFSHLVFIVAETGADTVWSAVEAYGAIVDGYLVRRA